MFKRIGIIGFIDNLLVKETVNRLTHFLESGGFDYFIEEDTRCLTDIPQNERSCTRAEMGTKCDLIIVVGGDGSMLHAARDMVDYRVPLLGVNRGRLGFLTDIPPTELEQQVGDVLNGNYVTSQRFMLECEIVRNGKIVSKGVALNDVVLQPRASIRMIEFSLHVDDQYVYTQRSDGLIVSTPTGSTAYALSGGGPIIHPSLNAIDIVPINPHTLSNRPIIVDGSSQLEIRIPENNSVKAQVVCDGQNHLLSEWGDKIRIRKKETEIQLIHPKAHSFYETCRTKLRWASE